MLNGYDQLHYKALTYTHLCIICNYVNYNDSSTEKTSQ